MLVRFCLYGFLKNQQYYDPFIILAFREKGLSFFIIGVMLSFRHVIANLFQIPSGILADAWGRKRAMILSFSAYITSFIMYGFSTHVVLLFVATFFFAIGDSFRSGTHKAMIFTWLAHQGREKEKTRFYGLTRSWSQLGSALSVTIAATIVFVSSQYVWIFWLSVIPYIAGIINILGYPSFLDGNKATRQSLRVSVAVMAGGLLTALKSVSLRALFAEAMVFKGSYAVANQYLQPLLKATALSLPLLVLYSAEQRSAVLVGSVYVVLYVLSSAASRNAHRISARLGGEERASRFLWRVQCAGFAILAIALYTGFPAVSVACFLLVAVLQSIFRPMFLSRLDEASDADLGATILSVDSQLESVFVMICAPLLGLVVDHAGLWPVGVFGALAATIIMIFSRRMTYTHSQPGVAG